MKYECKPSSKIFLLTLPRRYFFCGSFMLFLSCVCYAFVHVCLLLPWKGLTSWLSFVMSYCEFVTFPSVRVFTGSDLITGSDRIGPEIGYLALF